MVKIAPIQKRGRKKVDKDKNDDFPRNEGNAGKLLDVKETDTTPLSVKEVDTRKVKEVKQR